MNRRLLGRGRVGNRPAGGRRRAAPGRAAAPPARRNGERGSVSVEAAVLAPAFIALMVLAGVAGRTAVGAEAIQAAAHDAARAASISRDAGTGRDAATAAAQQQLDWQGLNCVGPPSFAFTGSVDGSPTSFAAAYAAPPGQPAAISVQVSCTVSFADIHLSSLPGMPAGRLVSARFTSPLDSYRSRG